MKCKDYCKQGRYPCPIPAQCKGDEDEDLKGMARDILLTLAAVVVVVVAVQFLPGVV